MSAGIAPGSRREHLWGIDNRCWRMLSWTQGTHFHSGSPSSFSPRKFLPKAQKHWGQTKVPVLPLFWEKAVSSSVKISVTSGNPWRRLRGSISLEKCDLRKQIGKTCFVNSWSQALRSRIILGLLCVAPENDANSISPCFLSCPSTVQEAAFLYWDTDPSSGVQKWKDARDDTDDLVSTGKHLPEQVWMSR